MLIGTGGGTRARHAYSLAAELGLLGSPILTGQPGPARLNEGGPWLLDPRCVLEQREESYGPWMIVVMMRRVCWGWTGWRWLMERVVRTAGGVGIVQLVTGDLEAARCPACWVVSSSGKEWVLTRPRDVPSGGVLVLLQWRKRHWRCCTPVSTTDVH